MSEYKLNELNDLYKSNKAAYLKIKVNYLRDHIINLISRNIITRYQPTVQNTSQRSIIITVPHAYCIAGVVERTCDRVANKFADILEREIGRSIQSIQSIQNIQNIQNSSSISITKIVSEQSRYIVDDNRLEGVVFKTPLWDALIRELTKTDPSYTMLFDVHSFPAEQPQSLLEHTQKDRHTSFDNSDIAILANLVSDRYNKQTVELQKYLGLHKIYNAKTGYNAILDVSSVFGVSSFLLEINESLSTERMQEYANRIVYYIKASPLLK